MPLFSVISELLQLAYFWGMCVERKGKPSQFLFTLDEINKGGKYLLWLNSKNLRWIFSFFKLQNHASVFNFLIHKRFHQIFKKICLLSSLWRFTLTPIIEVQQVYRHEIIKYNLRIRKIVQGKEMWKQLEKSCWCFFLHYLNFIFLPKSKGTVYILLRFACLFTLFTFCYSKKALLYLSRLFNVLL